MCVCVCVNLQATAGAAALVTQYFSEWRFYASHCTPQYPKCGHAFAPSGSLVKTVLLHSGQNMVSRESWLLN